jgi:dTDP-4-amino-4,6-dideoxygalactose transaminase
LDKRHVSDLAIFGGKPMFDSELHVGRPNIGDSQHFLARVQRIFEKRRFTNNGPYVQEFERKIAEFVGVKHCIAMCNATVALEIAIRALNLTGEVIVPSFTFIATAHALQWQEITPVFCDVDPLTHNLDPRLVERMITPRTSGIIGVHLWGRGCDVDALVEIASRNGLKLLFDAAHAFACSHQGRMIGTFGDAEVFSFHATKFFNTFEGGAVMTNNDELAAKIRLMKNFGFAGYDEVVYIGTNGKMSEISAAMGLTSLESLDAFIDVNKRNYQDYNHYLKGAAGVSLILYKGSEKNNYQYIVVEINEEKTGINRDDLVKILWAENIIARRYFYPGCHRMEPYKSYLPHAGLMLPVTMVLTERVMLLPTGETVGQEEVRRICDLLKFILNNSADVQVKMAGIR